MAYFLEMTTSAKASNMETYTNELQGFKTTFSIAQTTRSRQFKTYSTDDTPALEQFSKGQEGSHLCHG